MRCFRPKLSCGRKFLWFTYHSKFKYFPANITVTVHRISKNSPSEKKKKISSLMFVEG